MAPPVFLLHKFCMKVPVHSVLSLYSDSVFANGHSSLMVRLKRSNFCPLQELVVAEFHNSIFSSAGMSRDSS